MHPETAEKLRYFLTLIAEKGEEEGFKELKAYIKSERKVERAHRRELIKSYKKEAGSVKNNV